MSTLSAAGVQLVAGQMGTAREAIEDYKSGKLKSSDEATVSDHYGMGRGTGMQMGIGRGAGSVRGMGRGMGRGGGMG